MITKSQIHAELLPAVEILELLQTPACASVVLTWSRSYQRAYASLARSGYVQTDARPAPSKASAPFRWDTIRTTEAGTRYLNQLKGRM